MLIILSVRCRFGPPDGTNLELLYNHWGDNFGHFSCAIMSLFAMKPSDL